MYIYLARVRRGEHVEGIKTISLDLIRDEDAVELVDGDEFVIVGLPMDPFEGR